jgi:hypothetical protein
MNALRFRNNLNKVRKYCAKGIPPVKILSIEQGWTLFTLGCMTVGFCYGFWEGTNNAKYMKSTSQKVNEIVGNSVVYGGFGGLIGLCSPIVIPTTMVAYAYVKFNEE